MEREKYREVSASGEELQRVNVRLTREMHQRMLHLLPWGLRRNVLEAVLRLVLDAVERDGIVVAGAILDGRFALRISDPRQTKRTEEAPRRAGATGTAGPNPGNPAGAKLPSGGVPDAEKETE